MSEESNEYTADRSEWGDLPGPWQEEPDKEVWIDPASNLDCMIIRGPMGSLCGYVGVPPEHPNHGKTYWTDEGGPDVDVHGGLTYAAECGGHVCHVPEQGRPAEVWWFGFDCAHYMDVVPRMAAKDLASLSGKYGETYKDWAYVKEEVTSLARQLAEIGRES